MSKNIYRENLYTDHIGDEPFHKVRVEIEKVKIEDSTRFILSADVSYFVDPRDYDGRTVYDLELLLERYTSREGALRLAISTADDLKKRYTRETDEH